jgi:hypothetical protein
MPLNFPFQERFKGMGIEMWVYGSLMKGDRSNFAKEYQPQKENELFGLAVLLLDRDRLLTRVDYGNEF